MYLPTLLHLFIIQGVKMTCGSYIGGQVERIEIQSASLLHDEEAPAHMASGVMLELLTEAS
jgi:hypothetical protein